MGLLHDVYILGNGWFQIGVRRARRLSFINHGFLPKRLSKEIAAICLVDTSFELCKPMCANENLVHVLSNAVLIMAQ